MIERKVKPEDEIPVKILSDEDIRLLNDRQVSPEGQEALKSALSIFECKSLTTERMERFYQNIDLYINLDIKPLSVCVKGCNQCCHVPVDVSIVEAAYIAEKTGTTLNSNPRKEPRPEHNEACPFLDGATCSIYDYRPMACRTFHSIDSWEPCYKDEAHHSFGIMSHMALAQAQMRFASLQMEGVASGLADIRQWFSDKRVTE